MVPLVGMVILFSLVWRGWVYVLIWGSSLINWAIFLATCGFVVLWFCGFVVLWFALCFVLQWGVGWGHFEP